MPELEFTRLPVPPGPLGVAVVTRAAAALLDGGPPFAPLPVDPTAPDGSPRELPARDVPEDLGVVVTTSGTTGAPLHVLISRQALLASAIEGARALGPPGHWLTTIPVTSIGGLLTVVRALEAGAEPIPWTGVGGAESFTGDAFAAAGAEVLRRAASDGVPAYVSLVPTQLVRIARLPAAVRTLAGFAGVLVGGAAVSPGLRAVAEKAGARLVETYGATETCGGVVYDGIPLPGVRVDLRTHPELPDATVSIAGATLASGYLGRPDLTEASFVDGWFHSSDLGRCVDGRLQLLGRTDGIVKVGGNKLSLAAVIEVLSDDARVLDATVTASPDPDWDSRIDAHVVPVSESYLDGYAAEQLASHLSDRVAEAFGGAARPRSVSVVADLPATPAGKPGAATSRSR